MPPTDVASRRELAAKLRKEAQSIALIWRMSVADLVREAADMLDPPEQRQGIRPVPDVPNRLIRWFSFHHLPVGSVRDTSAMVANLAYRIDDALPESAEKTAGLRKLLEAKDCFVRAAIESTIPKE